MIRYDKYKDSGVDWLGDIPEHWEVFHSKRICKKITDGAHTSPDISSNDFPFLSVVNLKNGTLDFSNCLYTSEKDYKQLLRNGGNPKLFDVLFSKDGTIGETALICEEKNFVVGSSFIIISPNRKLVNEQFLTFYLSSPLFNYQARVQVKGTGIPRLSIFNFLKLNVLLPTLLEQTAIATYLDSKTSAIDRKVALLEQKITHYQQLRKSLINETVCRGLDKNVKLKDSGIEWIGMIPERWEVKRVKELFETSRGRVIGQNELIDNGKYPVYSSQTENDGCLGYIETYDFNKTLITWTTDGANAGTVFKRSGKFNCTNICGTLNPIRNNVDIDFMTYAVQESSKHNKRIDTNGAKIMSNEMRIINIIYPPLSEQVAIATYLDEKTQKIDSIVSNIKAQIETLTELRKTLINDVVTGKIKVTEQ